MDGWDYALLTIASFVAIAALVRLMRQRRDELTADMRRQMDVEKHRLQTERRRAKQKDGRLKKKAA